jgi:hypothetical protein
VSIELTVEDLIECIRELAQDDLDAIGVLSEGAMKDAVTMINERLPAGIEPIKTTWGDDDD